MSKLTLVVIAVVITAVWGWTSARSGQRSLSADQEAKPSPLVLSVVPTMSEDDPTGRRIAMAKSSPGTFYAILTNISKEPQAAFEDWNSWGYRAISFEVHTAGGLKSTITKKVQDFTRNFPSTFIILPGESMVYPISLDAQWNAVPALPIADQTPISITLKAIYEVDSSPEAIKANVWTGRLESKDYHFKLRHW